MVKRLYEYHLHRRGLILEWDERLGEIAPLPGFSKETLEEATEEIIAWIAGKEARLPSVCWGIECAKRSLRSVHLSLCSLGVKEGFATTKLKLGHLSLGDAITLVKKSLGKTRLRLDCNRAWSLKEALEFASHFSPTDFDYLEEPVQTFEELVEFSSLTRFPIALDESISEDWSRIPSLKAIVVKPMIVGKIPEVPPPLQLILSSSYETGLGLLHIANRATSPLPIGLDTYQLNDLLLHPIECKGGFFSWKGSTSLIDFSKLKRIL